MNIIKNLFRSTIVVAFKNIFTWKELEYDYVENNVSLSLLFLSINFDNY